MVVFGPLLFSKPQHRRSYSLILPFFFFKTPAVKNIKRVNVIYLRVKNSCCFMNLVWLCGTFSCGYLVRWDSKCFLLLDFSTLAALGLMKYLKSCLWSHDRVWTNLHTQPGEIQVRTAMTLIEGSTLCWLFFFFFFVLSSQIFSWPVCFFFGDEWLRLNCFWYFIIAQHERRVINWNLRLPECVHFP